MGMSDSADALNGARVAMSVDGRHPACPWADDAGELPPRLDCDLLARTPRQRLTSAGARAARTYFLGAHFAAPSVAPKYGV